MAQFKSSDFIEFARSHLGHGYVYGTFGQIYSQALAKQKDAQYGKKMGADYYFTRCKKWFGKPVCDCVGLFKWFVFKQLKITYSVSWDVSADGAFTLWCQERGLISSMPDEPGIAVFSPGHIGLYIGNGDVIEARGADYGIVKTRLKERPWTKWGRLNWLIYDNIPQVSAPPTTGVIIDAENKGTITGNTINVRNGPGTENKIIGTKFKGAIIPLIKELNGWWETEKDKWVSGKYVQLNFKRGIITGDTVNIRNGPGIQYIIVGTVKKGDIIPILQSNNGWIETSIDQWISDAYVKEQ